MHGQQNIKISVPHFNFFFFYGGDLSDWRLVGCDPCSVVEIY